MNDLPANPAGNLENGYLPINIQNIEVGKYYFLRKQFFKLRGNQWEIPYIIDRVIKVTNKRNMWVDGLKQFSRSIKRIFDIEKLKELDLVWENDVIPDGVHKLEDEVIQFNGQAISFDEFMEIFNSGPEAFVAWPHLSYAEDVDGNYIFEDWVPQSDDENPEIRMMNNSIVNEFTNNHELTEYKFYTMHQGGHRRRLTRRRTRRATITVGHRRYRRFVGSVKNRRSS